MNDQLWWACEQGDERKLRRLLAKRRGAIDRPNRQENDWTPLHAAANRGRVGCV